MTVCEPLKHMQRCTRAVFCGSAWMLTNWGGLANLKARMLRNLAGTKYWSVYLCGQGLAPAASDRQRKRLSGQRSTTEEEVRCVTCFGF